MITAESEDEPFDENDRTEQAVLSLLVHIHPAQLSIDELVRSMTDRYDEFGSRDRIEIAVRGLEGAGLVHKHGAFVFATRAAVRSDELRP
jgi:hypothetical protein